MAAESCLGAPVLALEVESVDISDDSSISSSEAELLVPSDEDVFDSPKRKYQQDKLKIMHLSSTVREQVGKVGYLFCGEHVA